jgi:hypothetical protein
MISGIEKEFCFTTAGRFKEPQESLRLGIIASHEIFRTFWIIAGSDLIEIQTTMNASEMV